MSGQNIGNMGEWSNFLKDNVGKTIIVECYQFMCPPCIRGAPIFTEAVQQVKASKFGGKYAFAKVNVQLNMDFMSRYGITSTPSTIKFNDKGNLISWFDGDHKDAQSYSRWIMTKQ